MLCVCVSVCVQCVFVCVCNDICVHAHPVHACIYMLSPLPLRSDARKVPTPGSTPNSTLRLVVQSQQSPPSWRRSRSLSDTEKTLDDAIKELDTLQVNINDDLEVARRHRHYSSNDSAMGGESELVTSPAPSASSEPSTLIRARHITSNRSDSAFSNNTSPTNSSNEGVNTNDMMESDTAYVHHRNASTLSSTSEPERHLVESSQAISLHPGRQHPTSDSVSLPTFSPEREIEGDVSLQPHERSVSDITSGSSLGSKVVGAGDREKLKHNKKWKLKNVPSVTSTGTYSPSRSPVLKSKGLRFSSETLEEVSPDSSANPTPTPPSTVNHTTDSLPPTGEGSGSSGLSDDGTVI